MVFRSFKAGGKVKKSKKSDHFNFILLMLVQFWPGRKIIFCVFSVCFVIIFSVLVHFDKDGSASALLNKCGVNIPPTYVVPSSKFSARCTPNRDGRRPV